MTLPIKATRPGRPRRDDQNARIYQLALQGYGRYRIYEALRREGAKIGSTTIAHRLRDLRAADQAGRIGDFLTRSAQQGG